MISELRRGAEGYSEEEIDVIVDEAVTAVIEEYSHRRKRLESRDRDKIYGVFFQKGIKHMEINEIRRVPCWKALSFWNYNGVIM